MSPAEDAALLLAIVGRHLTTLRLALDPAYPEEDWGFTAQQAVEAEGEVSRRGVRQPDYKRS